MKRVEVKFPTLLLSILILPLLFLIDGDRSGAPYPSPRVNGAEDRDALDSPGDYAIRALEIKRTKLVSNGPRRFDEPDKAMEFFHKQRLSPGETELPIEHMIDELHKIETREAELSRRSGARSAGGINQWQSLGPGNIGGRTRSILFNPIDPDIMYAAGVAGGIFKSVDGGAGWAATDDMMMNLAVSTLVMDPTDPDVIYAGTGEGFGGGSPFVRGLGIFKTTDGGATWNQLAGTVNVVPAEAFYYVNKIVISPNDSNRLYAATRTGVWKSTDGGENWVVVLSNPTYLATPPTTNGCNVGCTDIAIRTDSNPDVLFAAFGSNQKDGLFRSLDGGNSWAEYTTGAYQGRMTIAIAPSNNDVIYIAMADNGGLNGYGRLISIYRADDGANFSSVLDMSHEFSPWLFSYVSIATGCYDAPFIYSQGWYDNIIKVDPVDPEVVWVGGINTYRSDDGGETFGIAGYWFYYRMDPVPPTQIHPDQHEIVFHPDYDGVTNQTMFVGNDGGLFRTTNARAATSQEECPIGENPGPPPDIVWENMNNSYAVTQFYHGDAAKETNMFAGGAQDNGTSMVESATTPNDWKMIYGGDGGYVAIDPTNSEHLYIEIQGFPQIFESTDGGVTFHTAVNGITDTDGLFITPLAMDQSNPDILWTGGSRPWRTTNGAALWEAAGPDFSGPAQISAIAIAPSDSNTVYLGFTNGYVVRSTDALSPSPSWTVFTNGLPGGWVSSMAVDPADPDVAYLTCSNFGIPHVLKSVNGGTDWVSIDGISASGIPDIPVHWIAVRPDNSDQLYVGTEFGVFASDDGGIVWEPANTGFAHTVVEALDFKDENTLVAFSHGRGAYIAHLDPSTPTGVAQHDLPAARQAALSMAPNPFNPVTSIRFEIPADSHVRIAVHDLSGRLVATLVDRPTPAGASSVSWDGRDERGRDVGSGVYLVQMEAGDFRATKKAVLLH